MPLVEQSESGDRCSFRLRRVGTSATYPGISDTFKINKEITVVGRNPSSSDIFLDSNKNKVMISRLHARIISEKDATGKHTFKISDTSLNGTYINDVKISDSCDLNPGDTVTFGHLKGAVLPPGVVAQQPYSEFRFKFEKYPSTPPNKNKQKSPGDQVSSSPEFQRKTPSPNLSPWSLNLGAKTPLLPAANGPNLSAFLTPETPGQLPESSAKDFCRLPGSVHGRQSWRQHFVSDSEHSDDDDLMAYAATAGKAMEDSDEDIFSLQLPESPALSDDAVTTSNTLDHQTPVNITTVSSNKSLTHVSKECSSKRPKTKEEQNSLVKKANKRPRKSILTHRKAKKTSKTSDSGDDQDDDGFMYNTCASVDCIHPHNKHKLVDWVQCDDCDDWYHVMCTGLTLKSVQRKSAKFHCGCM